MQRQTMTTTALKFSASFLLLVSSISQGAELNHSKLRNYQGPECGVQQYVTDTGRQCGDVYKEKEDSACGYFYKSGTDGDVCGWTVRTFRGDDRCVQWEQGACVRWEATYYDRQFPKTCRDEAFGIDGTKKCRLPEFGMDGLEYKCSHPDFEVR